MSLAPNSSWHKIAESVAEIKFSTAGLAEIELHGKFFCIARSNNKIFACSAKCPHAGGVLADGYIDGAGNVVCPLHRYKFNPVNGINTSGEGFFLKTFSIEEREDGVFILL